LIAIERRIQETKQKLIEDIGLDATKPWTYYGNDGGYLVEEQANKEK
jgi:hypothetical protein